MITVHENIKLQVLHYIAYLVFVRGWARLGLAWLGMPQQIYKCHSFCPNSINENVTRYFSLCVIDELNQPYILNHLDEGHS